MFDNRPKVLSQLDIKVPFRELTDRLGRSAQMPQMQEAAAKTYAKVKNKWQPAAAYRWCEFRHTDGKTKGHIEQSHGKALEIDFGYSIRFLAPATHVLVAVYTAGPEIEQNAMAASQSGDALGAWLLDLLGLSVLEKAGEMIKQVASRQAEASGMGVSPFLSPGSVHGWALDEQIKLCSLLPLEKIGVTIREDAVLKPFKSLTCLIGLGDGYDTVEVGETCRVCSKRDECEMKHQFSNH